jgi:hypothetical protein
MPFKSKISQNIGVSASPTTVTDTVASSTAHTVIGLSLANTTGANINVSAKLNKGGSGAFIVKDASVLPGGTLVLVGGDQKLVLETGDTLTAWSSSSNSCDVIVSYLSSTN